MDILEFKVESPENKQFRSVCALEKGKLRLTLEPEKGKLGL